MRHLAALVLGGLFSSTIALLASCSGPTTNSSGPDAAPIDGLQACIDAQILVGQICQLDRSDDVTWCHRLFENVLPACKNALDIEWACNLASLQANASCPEIWPCANEHDDVKVCVEDHSCEMTSLYCRDNKVVRDACFCWAVCNDTNVRADCKLDGGTWPCDCYVQDLTMHPFIFLVGQCDQGPVCEVQLDQNCCNQFLPPP